MIRSSLFALSVTLVSARGLFGQTAALQDREKYPEDAVKLQELLRNRYICAALVTNGHRCSGPHMAFGHFEEAVRVRADLACMRTHDASCTTTCRANN